MARFLWRQQRRSEYAVLIYWFNTSHEDVWSSLGLQLVHGGIHELGHGVSLGPTSPLKQDCVSRGIAI